MPTDHTTNQCPKNFLYSDATHVALALVSFVLARFFSSRFPHALAPDFSLPFTPCAIRSHVSLTPAPAEDFTFSGPPRRQRLLLLLPSALSYFPIFSKVFSLGSGSCVR